MNKVYIALIISLFFLASCGTGNSKKTSLVDTTTIDTAGIEQLEKELIDLENQSAKIHDRMDSINKEIDQ
jgi:peptidoglycan hydrolase CwlO-like protein